jgi:hypothetical protein
MGQLQVAVGIDQAGNQGGRAVVQDMAGTGLENHPAGADVHDLPAPDRHGGIVQGAGVRTMVRARRARWIVSRDGAGPSGGKEGACGMGGSGEAGSSARPVARGGGGSPPSAKDLLGNLEKGPQAVYAVIEQSQILGPSIVFEALEFLSGKDIFVLHKLLEGAVYVFDTIQDVFPFILGETVGGLSVQKIQIAKIQDQAEGLFETSNQVKKEQRIGVGKVLVLEDLLNPEALHHSLVEIRHEGVDAFLDARPILGLGRKWGTEGKKDQNGQQGRQLFSW